MEDPIVTVEQGQLLGKSTKGFGGVRYYSFQGIPYAKPPLGSLRFKSPQPPESWNGIFDATRHGKRCSSRAFSGRIIGDENCLFLNVYTKDLSTPKAVIFWIHGGGFRSGSGDTDLSGPDFLITEDIVFVTINYRLGLLGFLRVEDPKLEVPGNAALKDMVMALKWVKNNIGAFGGDRDNITVMGESAGAASTHLISISPLAKGLFSKIICQSGTAVSEFALNRHPRSVRLFAELIGFKGSTDEECLEYLRNASLEDLIKSEEKMVEINDKLSFRLFGPVIEWGNEAEDCFLPVDPVTLLRDSGVPMIMGFNSGEGSIYTRPQFRNYLVPMDMELEDPVPKDMGLTKGSTLSKEIGRRIREWYYGDKVPSENDLEIYSRMQMITNFGYKVKQIVDIQKTLNKSIFIYYFTYDTPTNLYKKFCGTKLSGAAHADELTYLLQTTFPTQFTAADIILIRKMCKMWTNFAKFGQPVPEQDYLLNFEWKPIQDNFQYLEIGEEIQFHEGVPLPNEFQFWDNLYEYVEKSRL